MALKRQKPSIISWAFLYLVGIAGLEPATSRPPDARATRLRYIPIFFLVRGNSNAEMYINDFISDCNDNSAQHSDLRVNCILNHQNYLLIAQPNYSVWLCWLNCLIKCTPSIINGKSAFMVIGACNCLE